MTTSSAASLRPIFRTCALAAALATTSFTAPAHAASPAPSLCTEKEKPIFSCATKGRKIVSLCASPDFGPDAGTVQYRFGTSANIELQYPPSPQAAAGKFFFSATGFSGGGESHIRFVNGDYTYTLFDKTMRTGFGKDGNKPQFSSGIAISGPKGKSVRSCAGNGSLQSDAYQYLPTEEFDFID